MMRTVKENVIPIRLLQKLALGAAVLFVIIAAIAPERFWSNSLIAAFILVTLGLGGTVFIALSYVCGASWNVSFRRVPEAMAATLPYTGIALLALLAVRLGQYGWHHHGDGGAGTFWFKESWSNPQFWFSRAVAYILIWVCFSTAIIRVSRRQDRTGDVRLTFINRRLSVLFLAVYAVTFTLASCDWLMLLEPMWFSTIWGVYNFAGMFQSTLATIIILSLALRRPGGPLCGSFTDEHLHDMGKLLFGFSCFWMYIWFSQYMLIWYTNIPEETAFYFVRMQGPWGPIMILSIVLNWIVPFFILLPRPCKRSGSVMMKVAVVVLIGRWVDLYITVFPATVGTTAVFGIPEVAAVCGMVGVFGWLFYRSFFAAPPVPSKDPFFSESVHHHI